MLRRIAPIPQADFCLSFQVWAPAWASGCLSVAWIMAEPGSYSTGYHSYAALEGKAGEEWPGQGTI